MARYTYTIVSQAKPGRVDEFRQWYRDQHLADVCRCPGVVSARLLVPDVQRVYDLDAPDYSLVAIYELETDDPAATIDGIRARGGTVEMPMTDALDKAGMLQLVAHEIAAIG